MNHTKRENSKNIIKGVDNKNYTHMGIVKIIEL